MLQISDLLAKALATENINVSKQKCRSAYFDLKERNLVLPMWENMDPAVELMLVEHEVGHALFTPIAYSEAVQAMPKISHLLNVLEDARIERLFKERYPGSRKDFAASQKVFRDTDFFELKGRDLTAMKFIDRMNVFFKMGVSSGVRFSDTEAAWCAKAQNTVTFDDVHALAKDMMSFIVDGSEEKKDDINGANGEPGEYADGEDDTDEDGELFDTEDEDEGEDSAETAEQGEGVEGLESETMDTLHRKLEERAGTGMAPTYVNVPEDYNYERIFTSYKDIMNSVRKHVAISAATSHVPTHTKVTQKLKPSVSHLVAQFEMKKAAAVYARRTISKTGRLDVNKVAQYKVQPDIFRRVTVVPEGQNHGMVMLLDWSGSMTYNGIINKCLTQIIQLVMFCRATGTPYQVFAFREHTIKQRQAWDAPIGNGSHDLNMLQLFSSKMNAKEHNDMVALLSDSLRVQKTFKMTRTPLAPALMLMRDYLPKFKAAHKIDKLNLITFTDGANTTPLVSPAEGSVYISDPVTKKSYFVSKRTDNREIRLVNEVNAYFQILKDRTDCTITSYFIHGKNFHRSIFYAGIVKDYWQFSTDNRKKFNKDGFLQCSGYGRDAIYIIHPDTLNIDSTPVDDNVSREMTAAKIASSMSRMSKSSLKGRLLIERFADTIS